MDSIFLNNTFSHNFKNEYSHIIKNIFDIIGISNKYFIEIGFKNTKKPYDHTLFLKKDKWNGLWISNTEQYEKDNNILNINIDKYNLNKVLLQYNFPNNFDLFVLNSGINDFWLWNSLHFIPSLVMIPYNPFIEPPNSIIPNYDETSKNINLTKYGSSSYSSLIKLSGYKNYKLIGSYKYYLFFVYNCFYEGNFKKQNNIIKKYYEKPEKDLIEYYSKDLYIKY